MGRQITPMVLNLVLINIGIFLTSMIGMQYMHMDIHGLFALYPLQSHEFRAWQFATCIFLHLNFSHLLSNMIGLLVFGPMLERFWGARRFLFFYFFTGVCASMLYWGINGYQTAQLKSDVETYIAHPTPDGFAQLMRKHDQVDYDLMIDYIDHYSEEPNNKSIISSTVMIAEHLFRREIMTRNLGASGAVFGVIIAFGLLFGNTEMSNFFIPFPIKAKYIVAVYAAWEIYAEYTHRAGAVAHLAHISGMLFGFILVKYWQKQRNTFY